MAKYLKKHNEVTGEWEIVNSPTVSVTQEFYEGQPISDDNVMVNNQFYTAEEKPTLSDTLSVISQDISKLQRNVSWLAEHGGNGGTGGGGSSSSYGITVISPQVTNGGSCYINDSKITVEFMITGGTENDYCSFTYEYDAERPSEAKDVKVNTSIFLTFDNSTSQLKQHSLIIRAVNPFGINIAPFSFKIFESTLSLKFDVERAGKNYENEIFNILLSDTTGNIPLLMTNGMLNSIGTLYGECLGKSYSIPFTGTTTSEESKSFSLWNLIDGDPQVNTYYPVSLYAQASIGEHTAESQTVQIRCRVIDPESTTIIIGINGSTEETISTPVNSVVNYNFKFYAPLNISYAYYSVKLKNNTNGKEKLILGKYYDDTLKAGDSQYFDNNTLRKETTVSSQFVANAAEDMFNEGDDISLFVKMWNMDGTVFTTIPERHIILTKEILDAFPRQYNMRGAEPKDGYTMFASWNNLNASEVTPTLWKSEITNYGFLDSTLKKTEGMNVSLNIELKDNNNASGIKTDAPVPHLRLQNHAYATLDLTKYYDEIKLLNTANKDFVVSLSIDSDRHTDNQHTIFLWGENNADNKLINGFRVDSDKVYWTVNNIIGGSREQKELSCNISYGKRNTIDFCYDGKNAKIFINGVLNIARSIDELDPNYVLPKTAYFGCNFNGVNTFNFSDVSIYEFSIYTKALNDLQIVVNSKNARLEGSISLPEIKQDYQDWKKKNFIENAVYDERIPVSKFVDNGQYQARFNADEIRDIAAKSNIPTIYFNCSTSAGFTSDYFYAKHTKEDVRQYDAKASYYQPNDIAEGKWVDGFNTKIELQGTTTLGYRIKNLEMYMADTVEIDGDTRPVLFQPKKEWFPESQFTLKADVVDSSHANNAVVGEWINNCGIMENNPAMDMMAAAENRPKDVNEAGVPQPHESGGKIIYYDEDVTVKHTLEGFPVLLFISFYGEQSYTFIGIYSFNLGRYSYYNMGLKFLDSFCRRQETGAGSELLSCPAIIKYYKEKDTLGEIESKNVYSFEFGNAGNTNDTEYPVWSQYDSTIVHEYGEFKYPLSVSDEDNIWKKLCHLFELTSTSKVDTYYEIPYTGFDNKHYYTFVNGQYIRSEREIMQSTDYYVELFNSLNINNAASYFIIANAFGMTDSLGKNMTLRTWDGGNTWWTCFYDMDTALGITNDGSESVPVTAAIDSVWMKSENLATVTGYTFHDVDAIYAAYNSKLWGLLRCHGFLHDNGGDDAPFYELKWDELRRTGGKLSKSEKFTTIMEERINTCGELIYNFDYNSKYINDTNVQEEGVVPAINFLHGTRIEFVKDWLTKHFYFLDGMFNATRVKSLASTYEDSPLNKDIFTTSVYFNPSILVLSFVVNVTTPTFIAMTIGADTYKYYYISEPNKDTTIYLNNGTSPNSQLSIKASTLLSKIDGLQGGFQNLGNANSPGVIHSLKLLDLSDSNNVTDNPFNSVAFIYNNNSSLETLNLRNTKGITALTIYDVKCVSFNKLLNLDISNSDVKNLTLPSTSLSSLNITNSKISNLTLEDQNVLTGISFEGCNELNNIVVNKCNGLLSLNISDKKNLSTIEITNCDALKTLYIKDNPALTKITIRNNRSLENIQIDGCPHTSLSIVITGSSPRSISIRGVESSNIITLPEKELLSSVMALTIANCYNCIGVAYGTSPIETIGDDNVFDLSPFTSLLSANINIAGMEKLRYLRVTNIEDKPFYLRNGLFSGCNKVERIFGHIGINDGGMFNGLSNFYINRPLDKVEGVTPFVEPVFVPSSVDNYYTNVTITAESLANCFANTKCTLSDAYYILQKCDNVKDISAMFQNCGSLVAGWEDPLNKDTFSHCTNVENVSNLFFYCKINCMLDENLMSPFIANIKNFDNVFSGDYGLLYYARVFPEGNVIETVSNYNPKAYDEWGITKFFDSGLLSTLVHVREIRNSFNYCGIDFGEDCELFKTTTKLEVISDSFNNINGSGSLDNIFGGNSENDDEFSQVLSAVTSSFSFNNSGRLTLPIGNNFLRKVKDSIVYLGNENNYCFKGLKKVIKASENKEGENFPYDIFKNCTKLKAAPHLFEYIESEDGSPIDFILPGRIFLNCPTLENVSYCFANMGETITYELKGNGFVNSKIKNIDGIFRDDSSRRIGTIPYRLFVEEETKDYELLTGLTHAQAVAYGITDDSGILSEITDYTVTSGQYKTIRKTIEKGSDLFINCQSTGLTNYAANITTWRDLVEDNENYNPLEYILEGNAYYRNADYCPYRYKWNKFVFDNSDKFYEYLDPSSEKYTHIFEAEYESNPVVDPSKMPEEFTDGFVYKILPTQLDEQDLGYNIDNGNPIKLRFAETNYFCAPDIFRSFISSPSISSVFSNCGTGYNSVTNTISGMFGVCPGFLFEPVLNIHSLPHIFSNFKGMLPNRWKEYIVSGETEYWAYGQTYSPDLFKGLTNLYSIGGLFSGTRVWGRTEVPETIFMDCANSLGDISSLWESAIFIDVNNSKSQLPQNLFRNCRNINSIASMLSYSGPYYIYNNMFSYAYQPVLTNCSDFMRSASNVHGSVPELWNWPTNILTNYSRAYAGIQTSQITNYIGNEDKFIKYMRS